MFFFTLQAIVIALLIILIIHFLLTNFIYNEKKNKNKQKKKVIFNLSEEEQNNNHENKINQKKKKKIENNLKNIQKMDQYSTNYQGELEELEELEENNKEEKQPKNKKNQLNEMNEDEFYDMKNDIMKYIEKNELYSNSTINTNSNIKENDTKKEFVDYNFSTQLTDLNTHFEINNTNNQLEKKTDKKLIPPQINLNTKEKIDVNRQEVNNINKSVQWVYKDESVMNGGELGNGLQAFDDFNNNLATI